MGIKRNLYIEVSPSSDTRGWFAILKSLVILIAVFIVGFTAQAIYAEFAGEPALKTAKENTVPLLFSSIPKEVPHPYDRISEDNIHVYKDRIVIELEGAEWAGFTDTNSMDPVIDFGSNAIEIVPKSAQEVNVGDIVSYKSAYASGTIIHRVVETGVDDQGWYCRLKGDNIESIDPGKVRFDQIRRIVVAIIY
jgi:hypothetical protein